MPADNQHAEVERVLQDACGTLAKAVRDGACGFHADHSIDRESCVGCQRARAVGVVAALRSALRDGRLTPDQVGEAVGLRAVLMVGDEDTVSWGPALSNPLMIRSMRAAVCARLAVTPEDSDG